MTARRIPNGSAPIGQRADVKVRAELFIGRRKGDSATQLPIYAPQLSIPSTRAILESEIIAARAAMLQWRCCSHGT